MNFVYVFIGVDDSNMFFITTEVFNDFKKAKEAFEEFVGEKWDVDEVDMPIYDGANIAGPQILDSCIVKTKVK